MIEGRTRRWLVPDEDRYLAADRYHIDYKPEVIEPVEAVILHYTGSQSARGTRRWLMDDDEYFISVHFLIDRDGTIQQFIPLNERGAHAGGKNSQLFGRGNVNGRTIGIELMNVGPLVQTKKKALLTLSKKRFDGVGVSANNKHPGRDAKYPYQMWEAYGPEQIDALIRLLKDLVIEFPDLSWGSILGHESVDPKRKMDPGPAFPWDMVLQKTFNMREPSWNS